MIRSNPYALAGYVPLKLEPHLHTRHSDGQDTIETMFRACKSAGYDAAALTDHNTVSGLTEAKAIAADLDLVLIPGVEITTFHGHAVALGVWRLPEWRDLEARGMDALAREVHADGGVLSVAHPAHLGSPVCSGCAWDWPIEPGSVDLWEVLTAARMFAEAPLELLRQLLESGARVAPAGAGDVHSETAAATPRAATYVFVRERTPAAILEGLRRRRLFASEGMRLDFWLEHADGRTAVVGEAVSGDGWKPSSEPPAEFRSVEITESQRCVYAEMRDSQGRLEAMSAPIWISSSH